MTNFKTMKYVHKLIGISLIFLLAFNCYGEDVYTCPEHGELGESGIVIVEWLGEEYYFCLHCVLEFISNNAEEVGRIIKDVKELE